MVAVIAAIMIVPTTAFGMEGHNDGDQGKPCKDHKGSIEQRVTCRVGMLEERIETVNAKGCMGGRTTAGILHLQWKLIL